MIFDTYGNLLQVEDGVGAVQTVNDLLTEYGFTSRRYEQETGLWYFRARYYNSELGRFISRDPAGFVDGPSLYAGYFASQWAMDPTGRNSVFLSPDARRAAAAGNTRKAARLEADFYNKLGESGYARKSRRAARRAKEAAFSKGMMEGIAQGAANSVNGLQDEAADIINPLWNGFDYENQYGGKGIIPKSDWSKDLVIPESPEAHKASKVLGGFGAGNLIPLGYLDELSRLRHLDDVPCPKGIGERFSEFYSRLSNKTAGSADEALEQLRSTLDEVEDLYSGVPKKDPPPPPGQFDGRMYPPLEDFVKRQPDGGISASTKGHKIDITPDGQITITNKKTGNVDFQN